MNHSTVEVFLKSMEGWICLGRVRQNNFNLHHRQLRGLLTIKKEFEVLKRQVRKLVYDISTIPYTRMWYSSIYIFELEN